MSALSTIQATTTTPSQSVSDNLNAEPLSLSASVLSSSPSTGMYPKYIAGIIVKNGFGGLVVLPLESKFLRVVSFLLEPGLSRAGSYIILLFLLLSTLP